VGPLAAFPTPYLLLSYLRERDMAWKGRSVSGEDSSEYASYVFGKVEFFSSESGKLLNLKVGKNPSTPTE
jgi:hypothetical protein